MSARWCCAPLNGGIRTDGFDCLLEERRTEINDAPPRVVKWSKYKQVLGPAKISQRRLPAPRALSEFLRLPEYICAGVQRKLRIGKILKRIGRCADRPRFYGWVGVSLGTFWTSKWGL